MHAARRSGPRRCACAASRSSLHLTLYHISLPFVLKNDLSLYPLHLPYPTYTYIYITHIPIYIYMSMEDSYIFDDIHVLSRCLDAVAAPPLPAAVQRAHVAALLLAARGVLRGASKLLTCSILEIYSMYHVNDLCHICILTYIYDYILCTRPYV